MPTMAPAAQATIAPVPEAAAPAAANQPIVDPVAEEAPAAEGEIAPAVAPDKDGASHGISVDPSAFVIKG